MRDDFAARDAKAIHRLVTDVAMARRHSQKRSILPAGNLHRRHDHILIDGEVLQPNVDSGKRRAQIRDFLHHLLRVRDMRRRVGGEHVLQGIGLAGLGVIIKPVQHRLRLRAIH